MNWQQSYSDGIDLNPLFHANGLPISTQIDTLLTLEINRFKGECEDLEFVADNQESIYIYDQSNGKIFKYFATKLVDSVTYREPLIVFELFKDRLVLFNGKDIYKIDANSFQFVDTIQIERYQQKPVKYAGLSRCVDRFLLIGQLSASVEGRVVTDYKKWVETIYDLETNKISNAISKDIQIVPFPNCKNCYANQLINYLIADNSKETKPFVMEYLSETVEMILLEKRPNNISILTNKVIAASNYYLYNKKNDILSELKGLSESSLCSRNVLTKIKLINDNKMIAIKFSEEKNSFLFLRIKTMQ